MVSDCVKYFVIAVRWVDVTPFRGSLVLIRMPLQVAFCERQWLYGFMPIESSSVDGWVGVLWNKPIVATHEFG